MSQMRWTYVDDSRRKHHVGLYHGDRSGHLLIHCNARIVVIDFHVRDTRKYTFYINDELFDVHVERKNGKFGYSFEIDEHTKTPRNIKRWRRDRADVIQTLLWAAGLFIIIALSIYFLA
jgi:hypothetical protein